MRSQSDPKTHGPPAMAAILTSLPKENNDVALKPEWHTWQGKYGYMNNSIHKSFHMWNSLGWSMTLQKIVHFVQSRPETFNKSKIICFPSKRCLETERRLVVLPRLLSCKFHGVFCIESTFSILFREWRSYLLTVSWLAKGDEASSLPYCHKQASKGIFIQALKNSQ